jgi:stage II sporulation protein P
MDAINRRYVWIFFTVLIVLMAAAYIINTMLPENPKPYLLKTNTGETNSGEYYTVRDDKGTTIFQTGLAVHIDDRYISENNVEYVIIKIEGMEAKATIVQSQNEANLNLNNNETQTVFGIKPKITTAAAKDSHVVIYHTHTDESYIPTDGKASQPGEGGVFEVGDALTATLKNAGVSVTHSRQTHDPHDINAYHRSRRTAPQLIKEQPDAIYDIHRDSAPVSAYYTTINGTDSARVMMVVGRSNPNMKTNLAYARSIKEWADELYPGLVRGIFMGRGDYNQELYPTAMLFEIGTEKVSKDLAENAARCLGDVLIRELGVR